MLTFKINEKLLSLDKRFPQNWLIKVCKFTSAKAHNIIHQKQKSLNLKDLSELCYQLQCTPNDLLYWQEEKNRPLGAQHPLNTQLIPPNKEPHWQKLFVKMLPHEIDTLKTQAENLIKNRGKG